MAEKSAKRRFIVEATVTMRGAWMEVEAEDEAEAKAVALERLDFDLSGSEMSDWEVTSARPNDD